MSNIICNLGRGVEKGGKREEKKEISLEVFFYCNKNIMFGEAGKKSLCM